MVVVHWARAWDGTVLIRFGSLTSALHPTLPRRRSRLKHHGFATVQVVRGEKTKRGIPVVDSRLSKEMNRVYSFAV